MLKHDYVGSEHLLLGVLAVQEEALSRSDDHIGTAHIVLAVIGEDEAVAAGILRGLGVDLEHARHSVAETHLAAGDRPPIEDVRAAGHLADATTGDGGPRVTSVRVDPETFGSAPELAVAFGSVVFEPTWWPADTGEISYRLFRSRDGRGGGHYEIGATRSAGVPICVVGHSEAELAGRSPKDWLHGEWSEPPELAKVGASDISVGWLGG